jgi:hypothetical protein
MCVCLCTACLDVAGWDKPLFGVLTSRVPWSHPVYTVQTRNGRISMAGVNSGNVERLAAAIAEVTK